MALLRVARGELDLPGLGIGLVDEGEQRADLRTSTACQADLLSTATNMSPLGTPDSPEEYRKPTWMWRLVCSFMRAPRRMKDDSAIEG